MSPYRGKGSGRVGDRRPRRTAEPTGAGFSRPHLEPCIRFSRTRPPDVLHLGIASRTPRPAGSRRAKGSVKAHHPEPVRRLVVHDLRAVFTGAGATQDYVLDDSIATTIAALPAGHAPRDGPTRGTGRSAATLPVRPERCVPSQPKGTARALSRHAATALTRRTHRQTWLGLTTALLAAVVAPTAWL